MSQIELLRNLNVGKRVAEEEQDQLAEYFVETDQFRQIFAGEVDIIFGPKGSGKSAIYTSLLKRQDDLFDKGVTLIAGEIPRGTPAFKDIVADPPTSEPEFIALWKFYILSLVDQVLEDFDVKSKEARAVRSALAEAGLGPGVGGLRGLVGRVKDYVSRLIRAEAVEGGLVIEPVTGMPAGVTGKIVLGEPSSAVRDAGVQTVDDLLQLADRALAADEVRLWVLFDRLDVAFADSDELEANALRSLFRVYLDTLSLEAIRVKIFLRTDIWRAVTSSGFREASHVTRTVTIDWSDAALLSLVVNRLLNNDELVSLTAADVGSIRSDSSRQRSWFNRLVPDQIDTGRNPKTFEWILGRVRDGQGIVAPREVIHVLEQTRQRQLQRLERGEAPSGDDGIIFGRRAFRDALPDVSKVRLEQTLFAEYPDLKPYLEALEGEKTSQNLRSLSGLWGTEDEETARLANRAVEVGFFEARGPRSDPEYWVPFLYRPALQMVQGSAD